MKIVFIKRKNYQYYFYLSFTHCYMLCLNKKLYSRVKSLSKGGNSKKDILSSTLNLKESTNMPLSSVLPVVTTYEDDMTDTWPDQNERDEFDVSEESYEQEKPSWKNGRLEPYHLSHSEDKFRKANGQTKWKEQPKFDTKISHSDDDLNALLQVRTIGANYY